MHVIVLGAGVIGTTTAYYLARKGARVTVLERQPAPALETSYANAGQVSPGYSTPWAAPGIPLKAIKWLFQKHAPLSIRPDGSLHQLKWMADLLANCSAGRYVANKERMLRLAEYSRECLRLLRAQTGITYEERMGGTLQVFRTKAQFEDARRDIAVLDEFAVPYRLLGRDELASAEPALERTKHKLTGGLRLPNDETGDCQLFTTRLAQKATELGAQFRFNQDIDGLMSSGRHITGVDVGGATIEADCYVVALGSYSRAILAPLRLNVPVYPVKGYSLTVPIADEAASPVSTVLDETYKVAVTRFDNRIRIGGMAELAGFDLRLSARRRHTLEMVANDLFPGAGGFAQPEFWTGLRPMTPDSTPIVGASAYDNLFVNTGHGTLGWTMACGSGQLIADLLTGSHPAISTEGLDLSRYDAGRCADRVRIADGAQPALR